MDFIDYRKALGLSFEDKNKTDLFIKRIGVFLKTETAIPFDEKSELKFAYMIGDDSLLEGNDPFDLNWDSIPVGLQKVYLYLSKRSKKFEDFLSCTVALYNTYCGRKSDKNKILKAIKTALNDSQISIEIKKDSDGIFIFPKGAKELDDALVSEPLEWLETYSTSKTAWIKALKEYSNQTQDNLSEIVDKFRKALETFFQEFFGGNKSLENYKTEYGDYLKNMGVPKEISNNFETLLQSYTNFINNYAKHHDKTQSNVLEYILYQTGNIIRLLITLQNQAE